MNVETINRSLKKFHTKINIYAAISLIGFPLAFWASLYEYVCANIIEIQRVHYFALVLLLSSAVSVALIVFDGFKELPACPSCKKRLNLQNAQIAIATKNCPHCGESILANDT